MLRRLRDRLRPAPPVKPAGQYNLANQERWRGRAGAAAELLATHADVAGLRVVDVGAGNQQFLAALREHGKPASYRAYDVVPQGPEVTYLDLHAAMPDAPADVVVLLGVMEYIDPANAIAARLAAFTERYVLSTFIGLDPSHIDRAGREGRAWVRHQTADELAGDFRSAGMRLVASTTVEDGHTTIWLWEKAAG